MRPVRALRALPLVLALAPAAPAQAEWHIVPLVGLTLNGNTDAPLVESATAGLGTHLNIGGAGALLGEGILGVEGIVVFTPNFKTDAALTNSVIQSSRTLAVMGNVVLTTPRRWTEYSLRPFVSGGFGVMRLSVVSTGVGGNGPVDTLTTAPGFDIGGGAIGFFTKHTGVRFDLRYYRWLNRGSSQLLPSGEPTQLSFMSASVGVVIRR
jgi:hypothetical protein